MVHIHNRLLHSHEKEWNNDLCCNNEGPGDYQTKFSLDIHPGVGLLDHMVTLFLVFRGTSILFSICVCSVAQLCTTLCDPTDCSL